MNHQTEIITAEMFGVQVDIAVTTEIKGDTCIQTYEWPMPAMRYDPVSQSILVREPSRMPKPPDDRDRRLLEIFGLMAGKQL